MPASHQIAHAIRSLRLPELPPDLVVVVADNRTDDTTARAQAAGLAIGAPASYDRAAPAVP